MKARALARSLTENEKQSTIIAFLREISLARLRVFNMPPQENSKQITLYTIQPCSAIEFIDFAIKFDSFAGHYVFTILAHFSLSSSNCSAEKWFSSGKPQPMMKNACSVKMHEYLNGYGKKEREKKAGGNESLEKPLITDHFII